MSFFLSFFFFFFQEEERDRVPERRKTVAITVGLGSARHATRSTFPVIT
jgi:hypothetical protein